MASGETEITLVGNLVDEPQLRFTSGGVAVANFRVASTPRVFDRNAGDWRDGDTLFLTCSAWRRLAENIIESDLPKGTRVIVQGRLKQRSYEKKDGTQATVVEIDATEVGPSMRGAFVKVTKAQRQSANGIGRQGTGDADTPPANDAWATPAPAGGGFNGPSEEVPF